MPPLTVTAEEIERIVATLVDSIDEVASSAGRRTATRTSGGTAPERQAEGQGAGAIEPA
jgi:hypothetical protein